MTFQKTASTPSQQNDTTDYYSSAPILAQILSTILPRQLWYAESWSGQIAEYDGDDNDDNALAWQNCLHPVVKEAFLGLEGSDKCRHLYKHQAVAIQLALDGRHTLVCTGTGSGKSLCFWIPIQEAISDQRKSLLLFPTKALAQDQLIKVQGILEQNSVLADKYDIHANTLDGATPHAQ
jgi:ATP-dependent helicase YprA (DUF1998 family)